MKIEIRQLGRHPFTLAIVVAMLGLAFVPAAFGAQRTFVLSTGVDTNACAISAPCRSFGAALAHTDTGGEIIVLDSAGYGPVTIAQSVSIVASPGVYAGISVLPNFDGVVVNGAGAVVTLKGLSINGQGGAVGINFVQGSRLAIEDCVVSKMAGDGIHATAAGGSVTIADTVVRGSGGHGFVVTGNLMASIIRSRAENNGGSGVEVANGAAVSVADAVSVGNGGSGVRAITSISGLTTRLVADRLESRANAFGVYSKAVSGNNTLAVVDVTRSNISQNSSHGVFAGNPPVDSGDVVVSMTDSLVAENGGDGIVFKTPPGGFSLLIVGGNRIVNNGLAGINVLGVLGAGSARSRTDNTVSGNGTLGVSGTLIGLNGV